MSSSIGIYIDRLTVTPQTDDDDLAHPISSSMFDQTKFVVALVTVMSVVLAAEATAGSNGYHHGYHGECDGGP